MLWARSTALLPPDGGSALLLSHGHQIYGRLDISSPSPELPPSPVRQRAGNFQPTLGLKGSEGDSRAPAGDGAGDEGGRPQRAPQQHCKDSSDASAHSGTLPA